ncbi:MAG: choline dehydrogenase [Hyphomicrobiaceae bacterium]
MTTEIFDYVIVGAGSAGCALASRLSEDPRNKVALLEAGGRDTNPWIHIPVGYYRNVYNKAITWQYESGPEPHLGGRKVSWPRGKVLGGSSAINGLLYVRGQALDYDIWRQLGNVGWSYRDVLPYFKRSEDQERGADDLHGSGGPLGVSDVKMDNPICDSFLQSAVAEGIPFTRDFNGASQEGVGYYQLTNRNGRRCSSAVGYLNPAKSRPNLKIITHFEAHRVVLDGKRATGVAGSINGKPTTINAGREVILCAGAIGSPQLLELSGIGAGQHLSKAGVTVKHELPGVGENLQDHYQARFVYHMRGKGSLNEVWHSNWLKLRHGLDYVLKRQGLLTIGAGVVGVFAKSRPDLDTPDVQFHFIPLSAEGPGQGLHPFPGIISSVCQLRPESRGFQHIVSADPKAQPQIVSNYLAAETDRRVLLAAMHLNRRIVARKPFADMVVKEYLPGPQVTSDEGLMTFAREKGTTIFHPCGTAKMGTDPMAVVDARLRVHGISGLRVADASIMPTLISGNTNAPTIMIAEKLSDMIRDDARAQPAAA